MSNPIFSFRCLAYREGDHYVGVCLDLDIVEEQSSLEEVVFSLNDAVLAHVLAAKEEKFPPELMSRPAPKKYWKKLEELAAEAPVKQPSRREEFDFYSFNPYHFIPAKLVYA